VYFLRQVWKFSRAKKAPKIKLKNLNIGWGVHPYFKKFKVIPSPTSEQEIMTI
jgi:hypothetical protein